jgi:hypothetical protein
MAVSQRYPEKLPIHRCEELKTDSNYSNFPGAHGWGSKSMSYGMFRGFFPRIGTDHFTRYSCRLVALLRYMQ